MYDGWSGSKRAQCHDLVRGEIMQQHDRRQQSLYLSFLRARPGWDFVTTCWACNKHSLQHRSNSADHAYLSSPCVEYQSGDSATDFRVGTHQRSADAVVEECAQLFQFWKLTSDDWDQSRHGGLDVVLDTAGY